MSALAGTYCPHLISVKSLSLQYIYLLFDVADEMKALVESVGGDDRLKNKVLTSIFFESSTRTNCSFQAAMLRLGGKVIALNEQFSSSTKGESLEDTIQTIECYSDVIVLRHPQVGSSIRAANVSRKPIINAGDGIGEHPTQSLLDLYTIQSELRALRGRIESSPKLMITFLGDLKNGRTVHSLASLLCRFPNISVVMLAPSGLELPAEYVDLMRNTGVELPNLSLDEAIAVTDVLYVTRIQKERFSSEDEYQRVAGSYIVNAEMMRKAKTNMIVMHPLPRVNEISPEVDSDHRAAYFRQVENGMYVRMAILDLMLKKR